MSFKTLRNAGTISATTLGDDAAHDTDIGKLSSATSFRVTEFGGNDVFTPWYKFGDTCVSNCSFVSGDASVGFALILFYFITKKITYLYLSVVLGVCLGFVRILAGGHFLSDVIFSQIVVTAIIFSSFLVYKKISNE